MIRRERKTPQEIVRELAFKGYSREKILRKLKARRMDQRLDPEELQSIMREARVAKAYTSRRPSRVLPRLIGVLAIIMGIGAVMVDFNTPDMPTPTARRYSPTGFGFIAIVLGLILIFKPGSSNEDL